MFSKLQNFTKIVSCRHLLDFAISILVPFTLLVYLFWNVLQNLHYPFWDVVGGNDALLSHLVAKSIIQSGWSNINLDLGAPFGTQFYDFPGADFTLVLILKTISLYVNDPVKIVNIFYVLSFVMVYFTAFVTSRYLGLDLVFSTCFAIAFMCLPYHFLRGVMHMFLANYYIVPVWLAFIVSFSKCDIPTLNVLKVKGGLFLCVITYSLLFFIMATSGVYYAFFGLTALCFVAICKAYITKNHKFLGVCLFIGLVVVSFVVLTNAANFFYWANNGLNSNVGGRSPVESDIYGLRISQLLLPMWGHKIQLLADFGRKYHDSLRPVTEGTSSGLGIFGSLGFLYLIFVKLLGKRTKLAWIVDINLFYVLFCTVGGLGIIYAMFVTSQFRGLARVSIFIAYLSLFAFFYLIQNSHLIKKRLHFGSPLFKITFVISVVLFVIVDQVPAGARIGPVKVSESCNGYVENMKCFIEEVESTIPPGSMIFNLPYIQFPETPPRFKEGYNTMLRPYLYSNSSRWSYGSIKGRPEDQFIKSIGNMQYDEMVEVVQKSGYIGLFLDRDAFDDHGSGVESVLGSGDKFSLIQSADRRFAFYKFRDPPKKSISPSFVYAPFRGFYESESDGSISWVWSKQKSQYIIKNYTNEPLIFKFTGAVNSVKNGELEIYCNNDLALKVITDSSKYDPLVFQCALPSGVSKLSFTFDKKPSRIAGDPRDLTFRLIGFNIKI